MRDIASVGSGLLVLWLMFPIFFDDMTELAKAVKCWFPEMLNGFRNTHWKDSWVEWKLLLWLEFKLFLWLGCAVVVGCGVYRLF